MKQSQFKNFYNAVLTADEKHPVWWMGYLWLDLTERQAKKICSALAPNPAVKVNINLRESRTEYTMPSGFIWVDNGD